MEYPRKIGDQKELEKFGIEAPHEFLVMAVGSDPVEKRMQVPGTFTWLCEAEILGFIDLITGRKFGKSTKMVWKETHGCLSKEDNFKTGTIYRIVGYLSGPWGLDIAITQIVSEGETDAFLEGLYEEWDKRPKPFESDMFGLMEYDNTLSIYEGKFDWLGKQVTVEIANDEDNAAESLECAEKFCRNCAEWDKRFRESIANNLTDKANLWSESNVKLSSEEFLSHVSIYSLTVSDYKDGSFSVYYSDDADIFSGHLISVCGNITEGVQYVSIE